MVEAGTRVLMTGDNLGGVWTFTLDLAEGLIAAGAKVLLLTFGKAGTQSQREQVARVPGLDWCDSNSKLEWMENPWQDIERSGRWLLNFERAFQPDLVHLNTLCHGNLGWNAPIVVTAHSCVASWWAAVKGEPLPQSWGRYKSAVGDSLRAADIVTAPSEAMRTAIVENYGVDPANTRTIHNGRREAAFPTSPKEPFILTAGRVWDEGKNLSALTKVAPRLPWPLYVAGEYINPSGGSVVLAGCTLLGQLTSTELASWYSRAAIYALPARYEPFGLSALEAALAGCALVLGDIPTLREIWHDAAVFVPPDDPELIEAGIRKLIDDPAYRKKMAALANNQAHHYTQEKMTREYLETYQWAKQRATERRTACVS